MRRSEKSNGGSSYHQAEKREKYEIYPYTEKLSGKIDRGLVWEMVQRNVIRLSEYNGIVYCSVGVMMMGVVFRFPNGGEKSISEYLYKHTLENFVECIYQIIRDEKTAETNHITKDNYEKICRILYENMKREDITNDL